jgi:hypothetical protein
MKTKEPGASEVAALPPLYQEEIPSRARLGVSVNEHGFVIVVQEDQVSGDDDTVALSFEEVPELVRMLVSAHDCAKQGWESGRFKKRR